MEDILVGLAVNILVAVAVGLVASGLGPRYSRQSAEFSGTRRKAASLIPERLWLGGGTNKGSLKSPLSDSTVLERLALSGLAPVTGSNVFPRWHCWGIIKDEPLTVSLQSKLADRLATIQWSQRPDYIVGLTAEAQAFLEPLERAKRLPAPVLNMAQVARLELGHLKLVAFDLNTNTGATMEDFGSIAAEHEWEIISYWVVLLNDVLPDEEMTQLGRTFKKLLGHERQSLNPKFVTMYAASDLRSVWDPHRGNIEAKGRESDERWRLEINRLLEI